MYDNRKTPHCREIGGLRKGATGLLLCVKSQGFLTDLQLLRNFLALHPYFEGVIEP
jgi:hypothetical protein